MDNRPNKFILPLLIGSIAINIFMSSKMSTMEDDLRNLSSQISGIERNFDSSINNISYGVAEALKQEASIINDFQFEYGAFKDNMVDLSLNVKPKEVSAENKYYFSYIYGENKPQIVPATRGEGYNYYANIEVSIKDDIEVDFVIENENSTKTVESLEYIYNFEARLLESYNVDMDSNNTSLSSESVSLNNSSYRLFHSQYEYKDNEQKKDNSIKSANIYVAINEKIIDSFPMEKDKDPFPPDVNSYEFQFKDYSVSWEKNDIFELYILAEHEDGYTIRFNLEKFGLDANGEPIHPMDYDMNYRGRKFIVE